MDFEGPDFRPAKFVSLNGQIIVCGINTRNLEKARDMCTMHLHLKTGGVFVRRNDELTYLSPTAIAHVDIEAEAEEGGNEEVQTPTVPATWEDIEAHVDAQFRRDNPDEASPPLSREDEILAEIGHTIKAEDEAKAVTKGRRKKK